MTHLLPIGTVVTLKEGSRMLMIFGRVQYNTETDEAFDYLGCLYPEGHLNEDYNFLFNHNDIETIHFIGFVCAEEQNYIAEIERLLEEQGKIAEDE